MFRLRRQARNPSCRKDRMGGQQMKAKGSVCGFMIGTLMAMLLAFTPTPASAQVSFGVQVGGPPPVCQWGYYDYPPYGCAPYGYWGPEYFYNGIFIGVGPWWGWGYRHGWGGHRFGGYYRWHGREWVIENGVIAISMVVGVMTVAVVNGMNVAAAGRTDAVAKNTDAVAGNMDAVAVDMNTVASMVRSRTRWLRRR